MTTLTPGGGHEVAHLGLPDKSSRRPSLTQQIRRSVVTLAVASLVLSGCGKSGAEPKSEEEPSAQTTSEGDPAGKAGKVADKKADGKSGKSKPRDRKADSGAPESSGRAGADLDSIDLKPLKDPNGKVYRVTVRHRGDEEFGKGIVQVWLPNGIKQVRGLYVPGVFVNTDPGDGLPKPGGNREHLALKYHFGIVTHAFTHRPGTPNNHQAYCGLGSGNGLIRAFKKLAKKTGHPEIATAPYIMYTYSITTGCGVGMAEKWPKRMIFMSGGGGNMPNCSKPGVNTIPMLYVGGRYDGATDPWPGQLAACRKQGTPMGYALNTNGHEIGDDRPAIEPWWWALIPRRLPANVGDPLLPVDMSRGFIGNNNDLSFRKYSGGGDRTINRTWLPSKRAARAWRAWHSS